MQDIVSELESEPGMKLQRENDTAVLSERESRLLKKINRTAPELIQKQYDVLMGKKRDENLSEIEYENLIELTSFMESLQAERLENLIELSQIRNISLDKLIEQLELEPKLYVV